MASISASDSGVLTDLGKSYENAISRNLASDAIGAVLRRMTTLGSGSGSFETDISGCLVDGKTEAMRSAIRLFAVPRGPEIFARTPAIAQRRASFVTLSRSQIPLFSSFIRLCMRSVYLAFMLFNISNRGEFCTNKKRESALIFLRRVQGKRFYWAGGEEAKHLRWPGLVLRQTGIAFGQRGANRHPCISPYSWGTYPGMEYRR